MGTTCSHAGPIGSAPGSRRRRTSRSTTTSVPELRAKARSGSRTAPTRSASIATLALRALGNVTHAGGRTRGSFSTPLAKPLPNGWYLELSSETFADQQGRVWEATGIAPEREFEVFPADDPVAGHAHVLRELAAELAGKHE